MKTWTNPTVEELEVKMTANGIFSVNLEQIFDVDLPILDGDKQDPIDPVEPPKDEEAYPS